MNDNNFLSDNNLISPNQPGFRSVDSCTNQFLSINYENLILNFFGYFLIFQRILKCFKMVWAEISSTFYEIFFATENKEKFWMVSVHLRLMFPLVFLKDQFMDLDIYACCSWYILTIYLMVFSWWHLSVFCGSRY